MQKPNGAFYHTIDIDDDKYIKEKQVIYYPGEAAYGLLFLYEYSPNELWIKAAKKALLYLAKSRQGLGNNVPFDHWSLLATRKLFETENNNLTKQEYEMLKKHAEQLVNSRINTQIKDKSNPFYGAFEDNISLCSIGTIMEGLIAAYYCIDDEELKKNIKSTVYLGLKFLSSYQVKFGEFKGGIPKTALWKNSKENFGEIRIDNIQHVLSAWITSKSIFNVRSYTNKY